MNVPSTTTNDQTKKNKNKKQTVQQLANLMPTSNSKQHLNNITNLNSVNKADKISSLYQSPKEKQITNKETKKPTNRQKLLEPNKKTSVKQEIFKTNETNSSKTPDIRARYWAYLFDNLKRAVDEIYQTCENDNSTSECKEVILILENCTNDFRSLINRIILMKNFEKANQTNTRVNSLAWEVRKSSPRKSASSIGKTNVKLEKKLLGLNQKNKDVFASGFQEFLPCYTEYDDDDDEYDDQMDSDDEDDDDDDEDFSLNYKLKKQNDANPMDMFNHETFSDMQSINTDDISLNTLSITPPPLQTSNKSQQQFEQMQQTKPDLNNAMPSSLFQISSQPVQSSDLDSDLYSMQSQKFQNSSEFQQSLFMSNLQSQLNQQQQRQQSRFSTQELNNFLALQPTVPQTTQSNPNSNKLFNSFMPHSDLLNYNSNNLLSSLTNVNSLNNNNNLLLNESFEDYSFRLNRMEEQSNFKIDLVLDEDEEEDDDLDDYFYNENYPDYDEFNYDDFTFKLVKKSQQQQHQSQDKSANLLKQTTSVLNRMKSNSQLNDNKKFDEFDENFDPIDQVMLKAYEEEENLVLEIEKVQNKELLSVMAQEAKLTKQLSAEKLMHFNHQKYQKFKNKENDSNKQSTDFETFEINEKKRQRKLKNVLWENYKTDDDLNYKLNEFTNDYESEIDTIRTPGRALHMHEKLLSMSRKASPNERRRKHEEKQARAQEKREQFYQDRSKKLRELTKKIEEVRELKKKLLKVKKATMKAKLQRAEEKRQYLLRLKANKAAVEEQKAHEIAFINNLVAQNRKHDILERYEKRHEAIKHNLEEERLRKQEEQKAKEQAAELRRKELETQRMIKLKEMLEKRRLKQSKIEQTQLEKEKERIETAKAKERTREMRLAIIEAQFQANKQEVKKRIIQKQEEWSKRHESNLEEIRKKAFEMSILHFSTEDNQSGDAPTPVPYEKSKYCNVCM